MKVKTANATGFGAAADDYMERGIDLNEQLVRNKPATYFFRMKGDAMREAGIFDNDVLIVDRMISSRVSTSRKDLGRGSLPACLGPQAAAISAPRHNERILIRARIAIDRFKPFTRTG